MQAARLFMCMCVFLACTLQVFFMQAGFAMLSAGSVRAKNAKARAVAITLHMLWHNRIVHAASGG